MAAQLSPATISIAHGHARTAFEAGLCTRHERALAPRKACPARRSGAGSLRRRPARGFRPAGSPPGRAGWLYGHEQLAQLMATEGRANEATASLENAIERFPTAQPLWETLLNVQLRRGAYESLADIVERARAAGINSPEFAIYEGIHAAEFDKDVFPPALSRRPGESERWSEDGGPPSPPRRKIDDVVTLIDRLLKTDRRRNWAYAATAWRLADLIGLARGRPWFVTSPTCQASFRQSTVARPCGAARRKGEYLDQSVRGGTQTDGPLFSRLDPVIRHIRGAAVKAVENYVAQLPPVDPNHPLLRHQRDRRIRFSGSWSVRLRSQGHHSNHVHPLGWISSALYIALPDRSTGESPDAGSFTLGAPDAKLGIDLPPWRTIAPRIAHLVLFPSWMWHGTVPFAQGGGCRSPSTLPLGLNVHRKNTQRRVRTYWAIIERSEMSREYRLLLVAAVVFGVTPPTLASAHPIAAGGKSMIRMR